jgi:RNA polymerase sigma-70 factor (ECF subfamily)
MEFTLWVAERMADHTNRTAIIGAGEFQELYEAYYKRVYNYISFRINNHQDTEDLVSQVFERVIDKYDTYDNKRSPLEAWLIGIARNTVTDYFRSRQKGFDLAANLLSLFVPSSRQPEEVMVANEDHALLIQMLSKLSDKERNIVALKFAAELKNTDIAEMMGLSVSNVGVMLFRSLKKLRKEWEKEGQHGGSQ